MGIRGRQAADAASRRSAPKAWWEHMNETIRMQLSAYVDGELPDSESELLIRRLSQDSELRGQVAEYLELGRIMRGGPSVAGIHRLRQRVTAELDDSPEVPGEVVTDKPATNLWRPVGGVAVAAAVAVLAILGLQQFPADVPDEQASAANTEAIAPPAEYVVPPNDSELREYMRMHGESSTAQGANGINARLASFELLDEAGVGEPDDNGSTDNGSTDDRSTDDRAAGDLTPELSVEPAIGEEQE